MADYDIYREQLSIKYSTYGYPLWEPSPSKPNNPAEIGDVGFIRNGKFHSLFNALISPEDQSRANVMVPEHYEQLVPKFSEHISEGTLSSHHYCSDGISVVLGSNVFASSPDDFERVSFSSSRRRGAVLSLPVDARRKDTLAKGDFSEWIVKHIDHCFAFALGLGLGIERMEEIILVTGCDHTRSWTNVAFFGREHDERASFGVKVVHGPPVSIYWQSSPEPVRGGVVHRGPGGTNLPEDQCVFIRGFRVARSFWKLRTHLKAAAGPFSDDGFEPDTEVVSIPAVSKYRDPLHVLLDYIAERAPDCDMSLVHDDDLVETDGLDHGHDSSLETHGPEMMMDLLRKCNIQIHKASYGELPTLSSQPLIPTGSSTQKESSLSNSSNTEKSAIRLAMLPMTSQIWNTGPPSPSIRKGKTPRMQAASTSAISHFHSHPSVPCSTEALQEPQVDESFRSKYVPGHQTQGYTNNTPVVDPYTHSPVGPEGGSGSIRQTPPKPREAHMMGQQVPPALQYSYSSRLGGSASESGRERSARASHWPPHRLTIQQTLQQHGAFTPHGQIRPLQFSPTSLTHPKASHATVNATPHDHIRGHQPTASATNGAPDASPKKCRMPDCTYNAYYDYSEQEQTEYCGQGHELQAITTGLVASCVMCKGRPRLTGERVCGRTCRERERLARVQGSYYDVPLAESPQHPGQYLRPLPNSYAYDDRSSQQAYPHYPEGSLQPQQGQRHGSRSPHAGTRPHTSSSTTAEWCFRPFASLHSVEMSTDLSSERSVGAPEGTSSTTPYH